MGFGLEHEGEVERWTGLFQRAATRLLRAYDEHRVQGQDAFRGQEDVTATYPSLYALLHNASSRRAPAGEPVDEGASDDEHRLKALAGELLQQLFEVEGQNHRYLPSIAIRLSIALRRELAPPATPTPKTRHPLLRLRRSHGSPRQPTAADVARLASHARS